MADLAVRVEGLGKQYRIGGRQASYRTLRDTIMEALHAPLRRVGNFLGQDRTANGAPDESIWALTEVSFDINRGEVVGIFTSANAMISSNLHSISARFMPKMAQSSHAREPLR